MNSNNRAALRNENRGLSRWLQIGLGVSVLSLSCGYGHCADVVYVEGSPVDLIAREQLTSAAGFLGLSIDIRPLAGKQDRALLQALHSPDLLAVVISANTLPLLDEKAVVAALERGNSSVPLMISGVNEHTDRDGLGQWTNGAVSGAMKVSLTGKKEWYKVEAGNDVTRQLAGSQLPVLADQLDYLVLNRAARPLLLLTSDDEDAQRSVFVRIAIQHRKIFVAAESHTLNIPATPDPYRQQALFAALAAPMLFLRYAGGERAWHSPEAYANFTVDDPWLRQPYGHVNFEELLQHARTHDFHATIAFIPWNFDRSQANVAALFRANPDKLSICVHGNNHVHQEFGPLGSHPLDEQVSNMQQGLARMEEFTSLTHIPFDAVIVFPHSIAPEATFAQLRRNGYAATVNSLNVPSDATTPEGADFALRSVTLQFGDFPSLRRYSAENEIPTAQLAIDAFLGNPILLYAHESYFSTGMDAFDKTADLVNSIQPGMRWESLGSIVQHLYLEKRRYDGRYDLRAFSSKIQVTNHTNQDVVYLLEKQETFSQGLVAFIDGEAVPFEKSGDKLRLVFRIAKGGTREFSIRYADQTGLAGVTTAKNSFRANTIRHLSDFRDNGVSQTLVGRKFIKSYASNGGTWNLIFVFFFGLALVLFLGWYQARRRRVGHACGTHHAG